MIGVNKMEKKKTNIIYLIVKIMFMLLSIASSLIFGVSAIGTNFLPMKYIVLFVIGIFILNIILGLMLLTKKKVLNIISMILIILFSVVFFVGYKYLNKTMNVLYEIISVKEEHTNYVVLTLADSEINDLNGLENHNVGVVEIGSDKLIKEVKKTNIFGYKKYASVGEVIYGLELKEVDAIIITLTMYNLLLEENSEYETILKKLGEYEVIGKDETVESDVKIGESFILYISGLDSRDLSFLSQVGLSDVNILAVVNPTTHKVLLINIPRDYYVQVHGTTGLKDKLTHAGIYGLESSLKTVEDLFDININVYLKLNFGAVTTLVDAIDGIDVYSDQGFNSSHMRGWYVKKGMNHMDGAKALAFARERYAYSSGDRHRGKNQQDVIAAIINKVSQEKKYLLKYTDILESIQPYISTNFKIENVQALVKDQLDTMPKWQVESIAVNGTNSTNYTYSWPRQRTYVMVPIQETIDEAKEKISSVMKEGQ